VLHRIDREAGLFGKGFIENVTPELREAFQALIEATLRKNGAPKTSNAESNHDPNDSGSYGGFTDAVEYQ
jgi:hypothetical protein